MYLEQLAKPTEREEYTASAITNNFTYDNYGYLSSTGDWAITNDTLGKIRTATGHGITTTHSHDTFGNKVSHQASPTPTTNKSSVIAGSNWMDENPCKK